jgi:hypothetical protein
VALYLKRKSVNPNYMKKFYKLIIAGCVLQFNVYFAQISLVWADGAGSNSDDLAKAMSVDKYGNSYCVGDFNASADLDPGPGVLTLNPAGGMDIYISKMNSAGSLVWAKRIGGVGDENVEGICRDTQQNIYVAGWFNGVVDFDPGAATFNMTSIGTDDVFVCKLDSAGNFIWAKQFGGTNVDYGVDVAVDSAGYVYVTGDYKFTADFDPGAATVNQTSAGATDIFVCKLTSAGNFVWVKSIGNTGYDAGAELECVDGGVVISGWFNNTVDFDPGVAYFPLISYGVRDIFVMKLDASGTFLWAGNMGGAFNDGCHDVCSDSLGNIYLTGYFDGAFADLDPGVTSYTLPNAGSEDIFVVKLNPLGFFQWGAAMGGPSQDAGRGIVVNDGNVFVTGVFSETSDFDPNDNYQYNLVSSGNAEIFLSQLDMNGSFVAAAAMGGPGADIGTCIGADTTGGVYIHGGFGGYSVQPCDFDPSAGSFTLTSTNSTYDLFLAKYKGAARTAGLVSVSKDAITANVYPNPSNGELLLQTSESGVASIYNSKGQLVETLACNGETKINIVSKPAGIYVLQFSGINTNFSKRIMKE